MSFAMPEITPNEETKKTIVIDLEEYKELLMIKGRYEELKERSLYIPTVYRDNNENKQIYDYDKVTCKLL